MMKRRIDNTKVAISTRSNLIIVSYYNKIICSTLHLIPYSKLTRLAKPGWGGGAGERERTEHAQS